MDNCGEIRIFKIRYVSLLRERKSLQEIQSLKKESTIHKDNHEKLSSAIVSNSNRGALGKIAKISNKYPNAEPLKLMDYDDYLKNTDYVYNKERPYIDFEGQFLEDVLSANGTKESEIILSQAIINMYRSDEQEKQSMWCTDTSRIGYAVMKECGKDIEWISDPGGKYIQEMLIDPLMDSLDGLLETYHKGEYLDEYESYLKKTYPNNKDKHCVDRLFREQHLVYQLSANNLRDQIAKGKLQKKILKYLTLYFTLPKRKVLMINIQNNIHPINIQRTIHPINV